MSMICKDIVIQLKKIAPTSLAEDWDNVGLIVGNIDRNVKKIMVALDAQPKVIDEAIDNNVDLIVTHHPFPFRPIKKFTNENVIGVQLMKLIENKIALYAAHTNLDIANGGTNDVLAEKLGLKNIKLLNVTDKEKYKKIVVYVPNDYAEKVREAMASSGAGHIGNYSDCSFFVEGTGTFKPLENTEPFIGQKNTLEKVKEVRIESVAPAYLVNKVINNVLKVHPYEEVAYDIYPLDITHKKQGIGRIGNLEKEFTLEEFAELVKKQLNLPYVRVIGDRNINYSIKKVGLCTGDGVHYIKDAINANADVYVTGDIKYHDACDAINNGIPVIDAGHYGTEVIVVPALKKMIENKCKNVEVIMSKVNCDPYNIV